jgi:hypothetical protein
MNPLQPMNVNTNVYVIDIDNSSKNIQLLEDDVATGRSLIIYNDSDEAVFIVTGKDSAPTAVFPTSSNDPKKGKVIGPKNTVLYKRFPEHEYISAIQATSGTGSLYIHVGEGV